MKKFLFLAIIVIATVLAPRDAGAQKLTLLSQYLRSSDTLTNTTQKILTTPANQLNTASINGGYDLQVNFRNLTGTTATITCVLQSSLDGVNYSNHFKCAGTNGVWCDTLITGSVGTSGATYSHIWTILSSPFSYNTTSPGTPSVPIVKPINSGRRFYFRLVIIPSGTHTTVTDALMIVQN